MQINLDPKSSIFHDYLTTVLNSLSVQLELSTEKEFGTVTEEILFYLRVIMPLCPDLTVYCITQLLKCLFGTNMVNQYNDFMTISEKINLKENTSFFKDVMLINSLIPREDSSRRSSICSNASQKLALDSKNPKMIEERELLMKMENFSKNRTDRKWSTNKKELERYIRLFEPVVIQALKVRNDNLFIFASGTIITIVEFTKPGFPLVLVQKALKFLSFTELHDAKRYTAAMQGTLPPQPTANIAGQLLHAGQRSDLHRFSYEAVGLS